MSFDKSGNGSGSDCIPGNSKKLNLGKATNFMRQYRDPKSRELKKLSANQFMEVWSHYDRDGKLVFMVFFNEKSSENDK